ncbi:type II secretion system GspH family protein [Ralstonia solanacearum]|uniref:type II secretion system protein n=1 Tax=Ralstonia solanacearum TaxID=305 RepID=UPI001FF9985C|nr:type II secretion system protein [Ralstonia solanacearum]MDB0529134.1 type II secretion system GspH family protein [Ralstonia solanacearum]
MAAFDRDRQRGFTYLGLLILIAVLSVATLATLEVGQLASRRQAEDELLFIGHEFEQALRSYMDSTPVGQRPYPASLQDLLKDNRHPQLQRHLRRLYTDPFTGKADWGLVQAPQGGILAVYSLAAGKPIKVANFPEAFSRFAGAQSYRDWVFAGVIGLPEREPGIGHPE